LKVAGVRAFFFVRRFNCSGFYRFLVGAIVWFLYGFFNTFMISSKNRSDLKNQFAMQLDRL
jgi:hypothetical protein